MYTDTILYKGLFNSIHSFIVSLSLLMDIGVSLGALLSPIFYYMHRNFCISCYIVSHIKVGYLSSSLRSCNNLTMLNNFTLFISVLPVRKLLGALLRNSSRGGRSSLLFAYFLYIDRSLFT